MVMENEKKLEQFETTLSLVNSPFYQLGKQVKQNPRDVI